MLPSPYFLFLAFRCWQVEKSIACKSWISAEFLWFPSSRLQQTISMSLLSEKFLIKFMKRLLNSWLKWNTLVYCSWCHRCQAMNSSSASPRALSSSGEAAAPRQLRCRARHRRQTFHMPGRDHRATAGGVLQQAPSFILTHTHSTPTKSSMLP